MAKKKTAQPPVEKKAAAEYYKLNTKAVEDLVTADESNSPVIPEEELRKYQSGSKIKLSHWLKITLIKLWFNGAVCFFFMWGLGVYLPNMLDQIVVTGIAMGFVNDILVKNLLHFMEKTPGSNNRFMMFPQKGFVTLPLNVLYAFLLMACVVLTYQVINWLIIMLFAVKDTLPLGVEPILFGVFTVAWDSLFLKMKQVFSDIVKDAKRQARSR